MTTSPTIAELAKALSKFQTSVPAIKRTATNPFFKSKYATLEDIIDTIRKPLSECGLSFVQLPTSSHGLTTMLMHTSGEYVESTYDMEPKDPSPQAKGSCITYQRRYALTAILGLATEDDDDGNAATRTATAPAPIVQQYAAPEFATPKQKKMIVELLHQSKPDLTEMSDTYMDDLRKALFQLTGKAVTSDQMKTMLKSQASEIIEKLMTTKKISPEK